MSPQTPAPKNWPPALPYLTAPIYSRSLAPDQLTSLQTQPPDLTPVTTPKGPSPLVKITPISSTSHPANGQCGLFTSSDLKPATFILQYLGEIHPSAAPGEDDRHATSNYDLSLDRFLGVGIDAQAAGNEARFINDYRGVAEKPNAEFREIWDERRKERGMGVFVFPEGRRGKGKGVKKGEEILVSYGSGFWGARREREQAYIGI